MLWYLLAVAVALVALVAAVAAGVGAWGSVRVLLRAVGGAGDRVASASTGLDEGLAALQAHASQPPVSDSAAGGRGSRGGDAPALEARVRAARGR